MAGLRASRRVAAVVSVLSDHFAVRLAHRIPLDVCLCGSAGEFCLAKSLGVDYSQEDMFDPNLGED